MKREDVNFLVSILLFFSITATGVLGFIQSELELRKFFPHRYFAYATLCLAAIHLYLNFGRLHRYLKNRFGSLREKPKKRW